MTPSRDITPVEALDVLLDLLADRIAARIRTAPSSTDLVDQKSEQVLAELRISARTYLAAARAGQFPTSRRGRRVVAKHIDVAAWVKRGAPFRCPLSAEETESPGLIALRAHELDNEARGELGLALKPFPRKRGK